VSGDGEPVRGYVAGLPEASGTFTGTFSDDTVITELLGSIPDVFPIEIDTGYRPNPLTAFLTTIVIRAGDETWELPVDHVDLPGGNRVRVWVRRPGAGGQP
jgi:hypothetical protein